MSKKEVKNIDGVEMACKMKSLADLRLKMKMAQTLKSYIDQKMKLNLITGYTLGIHVSVFEHLKQVANKERFASKRIDVKDFLNIETIRAPMSYIDLRVALLKHYIEDKTIPTLARLRLYFERKSIARSDATLKRYLKIYGFVWRKLPNSKKGIIIEDPKRVMERHRYLRQIQEYRDQGRPIVYVEERHYSTDNLICLDFEKPIQNATKWYVIIATEKGLISTFLYTNSDKINQISWLHDMMLPHLPENCVVVLEDTQNWELKDAPKLDTVSSKKDLKSWLDENGVHYDPGMHKAELMLLVENFTQQRSKSASIYLESLGYAVLRKEKDFPNLSLTAPIAKCILESLSTKTSTSIGKHIMAIVNGITEQAWREMNERMKEEEKLVLEEDLMMGELIDKIIELAADGGTLDEKLDDYREDPDFYIVENEKLTSTLRSFFNVVTSASNN